MTPLLPELIVFGIALGLVFSLVCYLATNVSPGGMITPGWLALVLVHDAGRMALIAGVIVATYAIVRVLEPRVLLYGKRLFSAVVIVGVFLQISVYLLATQVAPALLGAGLDPGSADQSTLGFVIPGLIAYQLLRQPIAGTLLSTVTVTAVTYLFVLGAVALHLVGGEASEGVRNAVGHHVATTQLAGAAAVALAGMALLARAVRRPGPAAGGGYLGL